ncbi:MAG: hypothetical protein AAGF12_28840 [Myxococcota bacterium]
MLRKVMFLAVVGGAVAMFVSGCRVRAHGYVPAATVTTGYSGTVVYQAPPQPRVVVNRPPPAPYQGAVWVQGHWNWNGAQYVWVNGHYIQPRVGYVYAQPRWERRGNGWVHVQGNWRPHQGRVHVQRRNTVRVQPRVQRRNTVRVRSPRVRGTVQVR